MLENIKFEVPNRVIYVVSYFNVLKAMLYSRTLFIENWTEKRDKILWFRQRRKREYIVLKISKDPGDGMEIYSRAGMKPILRMLEGFEILKLWYSDSSNILQICIPKVKEENLRLRYNSSILVYFYYLTTIQI
jgi:hypothetical protein